MALTVSIIIAVILISAMIYATAKSIKELNKRQQSGKPSSVSKTPQVPTRSPAELAHH